MDHDYMANYNLLSDDLLAHIVEYVGIKNSILILSLVNKKHHVIVASSKLHIDNNLYIRVSDNQEGKSKTVLYCYDLNKQSVRFDYILANVTVDEMSRKTLRQISAKSSTNIRLNTDYNHNKYKHEYQYGLNGALDNIIMSGLILDLKKNMADNKDHTYYFSQINSNDYNCIVYCLCSIICAGYGFDICNFYPEEHNSYVAGIYFALPKAIKSNHLQNKSLLDLHISNNRVPPYVAAGCFI